MMAWPEQGDSSMEEAFWRGWENLVGRSLPFWRFFYGRMQATFPEQLSDVDGERFYRAVNRVVPSLIRDSTFLSR